MKLFKKYQELEAKWIGKWQQVSRRREMRILGWILVLALPFLANYFLQLSQNNWSFQLATKFAFSWHTSKFLLSTLVLSVILVLFISLLGSVIIGSLFFSIGTIVLGIANFLKMFNRMEPLYPDDMVMITEWGLLRDIIGVPLFIGFVLLMLVVIFLIIRSIWYSLRLKKWQQVLRVTALMLSLLSLGYISDFNDGNNALRKAYNKTALWIPYSQKMNYYNTGFVAGFLYNLKVEPMNQPKNYSKKTIEKLTKKYQVNNQAVADEELPNIVYIMSESFSDPLRLGITATQDPLATYRKLTADTYSGQMLSQNYGGGTANIEFEALTSLSLELFNSQLTTPYTMLVPKKETFPTIVSRLKAQNYYTTAIHPYNTSMYKRKDVYRIFGFDQFLDENTMVEQEKTEDNPYISDQSAFDEVYRELTTQTTQPNFVHLVTMQGHMPYGKKYPDRTIEASGDENNEAIADYMTDLHYSSEALKNFLSKVEQLNRRTLVVFWGDHLPSLYSEEFQAKTTPVDLHLTEFFMYDSENLLKNKQNNQIISPFYFTSHLMEEASLPLTPMDNMLNQLSEYLPAFEKEHAYVDGQWQAEIELSKEAKQLYEDYQVIQYDIAGGEQYVNKTGFMKVK